MEVQAHTERFPLPYKHQEMLVEQHKQYVGALWKHIAALEFLIIEYDKVLNLDKNVIFGTTSDKLNKLKMIAEHSRSKVELSETQSKYRTAHKMMSDIVWHFDNYFKPDYLKKVKKAVDEWESTLEEVNNYPKIKVELSKDLIEKGYNLQDDEVKLYYTNRFITLKANAKLQATTSSSTS